MDLLHHIQKTESNQPPDTHKETRKKKHTDTITKTPTTIIRYYKQGHKLHRFITKHIEPFVLLIVRIKFRTHTAKCLN